MTQLDIRRVGGALGAEIAGVDLAADLSDEVIAAIRAAFVEHQVIFFRGQRLAPAEQVRLGARFGPLNIHPYVAGMAAHPQVMEVIKEPSDRVNFGGGWHSDMSFLEHPSIGSILYAVETPAFGGDTLFASQAAAFEALSPAMRATLEGLSAVHSAAREYSPQGHSAQRRASMSIAEAEGAVGEFVHPVVLTHSETRHSRCASTAGESGSRARCSTSCSSTAVPRPSPAGSAGNPARSPSGTTARSGTTPSTTTPASAATCAA
jgi:taurine dioxygenase